MEEAVHAVDIVTGNPFIDAELSRMYIPDSFGEKFAALIINECVNVCLQQRDPSNLNYKPSEKFADAIKHHFGV